MSGRGDVERKSGAPNGARAIYLHAGFHKTGTTSFQTFVERNRARHPHGFAFFGKWNPRVAALHRAIAAFCATPPPRRAAAREGLRRAAHALAQEIAAEGAPRTLVSLESLCGTIPQWDGARTIYPYAEEILRIVETALAAAVAAPAPTLLFSTRERGSWTRSLYKHLVKSRGLNVAFADFAAHPKFANLNWHGLIAHVAGAAPREIVVAPMERDATSPFGPGAAFLAHMGVAPEDLATWSPPARCNEGLSERTLAALQTPPLTFMPALVRKRIAKALDARPGAGAAFLW